MAAFVSGTGKKIVKSHAFAVWLCLTLLVGMCAGAAYGQTSSNALLNSSNYDTPPTMNNWQQNCQNFYNNAPSHDYFITPTVQCLANIDVNNANTDGVIPLATTAFLKSNSLQTYFTNVVYAMITLAVVFYGYKLMMGEIERPTSDTYMMMFRIGGVIYFLNNAPSIYAQVLSILWGLGDSIAGASVFLGQSTFCNPAGATGTSLLWTQWDCMLTVVLGLSGGTLLGMSLAAFLIGMLTSGGIGILIFFMGVSIVFSLIKGILRFVQMFLMATLALSFMFVIGYLCVPLLIFRGTMTYFRQWINIVVGFMLVPPIVFGYMGMMLVGLNVMLFSGSYSVFHAILGGSASGFTPSTMSNLLGTKDPLYSVTNPVTGHTYPYTYFQEQYVPLFSPNYNNAEAVSSFDTTYQVNKTGADTGALGDTDLHNMTATQYIQGTMLQPGQTLSGEVGFRPPTLNLDALSSNAGVSTPTYLQNIALSFASAALFAYMMLSLFSYIPQLVTDLSVGTDGAGGGLASVSSIVQSNLMGGNALTSFGKGVGLGDMLSKTARKGTTR